MMRTTRYHILIAETANNLIEISGGASPPATAVAKYVLNACVMMALAAGRMNIMYVQEYKNPNEVPKTTYAGLFLLNENPSLIYAYSPPELLIMVPSSTYARPPPIAIRPPRVQNIKVSPNEPEYWRT